MSVPILPTPELGMSAVPAPHPGARRVMVALGVLGGIGAVLALLTLQARAWPWVAIYVALAASAWATWRARRWARPVTVALGVVGMVQPALGLTLGAGDPLPTLVFGVALLALAGGACTLLTRPARTWFAAEAARRSLVD
jgi:hypothetical protein